MRRRPSRLVTATAAVIVAVCPWSQVARPRCTALRRSPPVPQLTVVAPLGSMAPLPEAPPDEPAATFAGLDGAGQAGHRRRRQGGRRHHRRGAGPQHRPDSSPTATTQPIAIASVVKLFIADDLLLQESKGQTQLSPADRAGARRHAAVLRRQRGRDLLEPQRRQRDRHPGRRALRAGRDARAVQRALVQHDQHARATWSTTTTCCCAGSGGLPPEQANIILSNLAASTPTAPDGMVPGGVYPQRFGIPEGLYAEPVAVKQGWMCCWIGADWMHLSTGVIGPDRRYVMAIGSMQPTGDADRAQHHHPGRQDDVPRRADLASERESGRAGPASLRVRCSPCSRRHAATFAWSPDSSTSGTSRPRQLGGRV